MRVPKSRLEPCESYISHTEIVPKNESYILHTEIEPKNESYISHTEKEGEFYDKRNASKVAIKFSTQTASIALKCTAHRIPTEAVKIRHQSPSPVHGVTAAK